MRTMNMLAAALIAVALAGCSTSEATPQPVKLLTDNYCAVAKKRTWSVNDTRETIDEARKHNAAYERLCPLKGTPPAPKLADIGP